ncbi:Uncharacterised protein [Enterobacter ludwigii]|nr:hypothetical protein [Enterobacter ludwigii]CZU53229.1 Uncharacterised protein [Enterobacter ludwigii]CZY13435.1 Uncharacterised protein [Enterobacter ludwigii]SAB83941.1 Uncharacterised protein [Enterobacter ludwigii]SAG95243.1 Uncharacterised protein [Enterobacter ludwigii]
MNEKRTFHNDMFFNGEYLCLNASVGTTGKLIY